MNEAIKIPSKANSALNLKIVPGHFATSHSHVNYYIDMTTIKTRRTEADLVASLMASKYHASRYIDSIVCMDGCEVIGAYLAEHLTQQGIMSVNRHNTIYVVTPECNSDGQLIFRDNLQPMVKGKNILLLLASATTGKTIQQSLSCIRYYGGMVQGISAIFSASDTVAGYDVDSVFNANDLPNYEAYSIQDCPFCKAGHKLDAIVNSYGYSKL